MGNNRPYELSDEGWIVMSNRVDAWKHEGKNRIFRLEETVYLYKKHAVEREQKLEQFYRNIELDERDWRERDCSRIFIDADTMRAIVIKNKEE
jgi:hypothetical protein